MSRAGSWTRKRRGLNVVGTVSAMGKTTDSLIALANEVSPAPDPGSSTCCSRRVSASRAPSWRWRSSDLGEEAVSYTGSQAGILTDSAHTRAKIREIRGDRIRASLERGQDRARRRVPGLLAGHDGHHDARARRHRRHRGRARRCARRRLRDLLGRRRRVHRRPANRPGGAQDAGRLVRRDARDGRLGRQGADAPLGGARTKPRGAHPCALDVLRRGGNLGAGRRGNGAADRLGRDALGDGRRLHAHRASPTGRAWRR